MHAQPGLLMLVPFRRHRYYTTTSRHLLSLAARFCSGTCVRHAPELAPAIAAAVDTAYDSNSCEQQQAVTAAALYAAYGSKGSLSFFSNALMSRLAPGAAALMADSTYFALAVSSGCAMNSCAVTYAGA